MEAVHGGFVGWFSVDSMSVVVGTTGEGCDLGYVTRKRCVPRDTGMYILGEGSRGT